MTHSPHETNPYAPVSKTPHDARQPNMGPGRKRRGGRHPDETQAGTAIDRRRIQNRMAQRTYRHRKELAIESLKERVLELEKMNEDMGREYINMTDMVLQQVVVEDSTEIARNLKETTLRLLHIARNVEAEQSEDLPMTNTDHEESEPQILLNGAEEDLRISATSTDQSSRDSRNMSNCASVLKTTQVYDPTPNLAPNKEVEPPVHPQFQDTSYTTSMADAQREHYVSHSALPGLSCAFSPRPSCSYAAQESTFGRRLHRQSQQAGYLLASMKTPPPFWYLKVFGFCLHFETKEEICRRMGDAVRKTKDMTLHNWRYPFTNLGGAGLFYPHSDNCTPDGNQASGELPVGNRYLQHEPFQPPSQNGMSMGPFSKAIEEVRDLRLNPQLRILDPGFQGDWFDTDEVEICLRGYGVTIPANKDFVTAQIDMAMFQSDSDGAPVGVHADGGKTSPISIHTLPGDNWNPSRVKTTKVNIDVERLITSLVSRMICLGRTPAVQPKDVREALQEAIMLDNEWLSS